jgi:hypothetical protein
MATGKTAKKVAGKKTASRPPAATYAYVILAKNKKVTVVSNATGELIPLTPKQYKDVRRLLIQRQRLGDKIAKKLKSFPITGFAIEDCTIFDGRP